MITLRNLDQLLKENLKDKVKNKVDLNIPIKDNIILDDTRIERIAPTVHELTKNGCKVCLISHFGRPDGKNNEKFSLKQVIPSLKKHLKKDIIFSKNLYGETVETALSKSTENSVILFENTRFDDGEEKNSDVLAEKISKAADFYINDAFSVSHRSHVSTTGLSQKLSTIPMQDRYLEQEIEGN